MRHGAGGGVRFALMGKFHPETRNPALVDMMEVMGYMEYRYSGVPTMRREMESFGLPQPEFVNRNGEFKVIFRNGLGAIAESPKSGNAELTAFELSVRERRLLEFCATPRMRAEVTDCLGVLHYYAFSRIVPKLVNAGLLRLSRPV